MGADRRGPLAAFIVVAIIAVVLLVTSVRSQAAPGWLDPDKVPATAVAAPVAEPHVWGAATGAVQRVVHEGVVLVRRAAESTGAGAAAPASASTGAVDGENAVSATAAVPSAHRAAPRTTHHADPADPADPADSSAPASLADQVDRLPVTRDHGVHAGGSVDSDPHRDAMARSGWAPGTGASRP